MYIEQSSTIIHSNHSTSFNTSQLYTATTVLLLIPHNYNLHVAILASPEQQFYLLSSKYGAFTSTPSMMDKYCTQLISCCSDRSHSLRARNCSLETIHISILQCTDVLMTVRHLVV